MMYNNYNNIIIKFFIKNIKINNFLNYKKLK